MIFNPKQCLTDEHCLDKSIESKKRLNAKYDINKCKQKSWRNHYFLESCLIFRIALVGSYFQSNKEAKEVVYWYAFGPISSEITKVHKTTIVTV